MKPAEIQAINELQTGTPSPYFWERVHPMTCPNRGDGDHGDDCVDKGVLVATHDGMVCPYCGHTQQPIPGMSALKASERPPVEDFDETELREAHIRHIERMIKAYTRLLHERAVIKLGMTPTEMAKAHAAERCAKTMLRCLHRALLAAEGVETRPGRHYRLTGWTMIDDERPPFGPVVDLLSRRAPFEPLPEEAHDHEIVSFRIGDEKDWSALQVTGYRFIAWRLAPKHREQEFRWEHDQIIKASMDSDGSLEIALSPGMLRDLQRSLETAGRYYTTNVHHVQDHTGKSMTLRVRMLGTEDIE